MPEDAKKETKKWPELGSAEDLSARIRAGGNVTENLQRWAEDADPKTREMREFLQMQAQERAKAEAEERRAFEEFRKRRAAKKGAK